MLERDFQKRVIDFLKSKNIYHIKIWRRRVYASWHTSDLLICLKGKFIAIELKNEKGKATPLQLYNIEQIKKSGGQAYILKPENFEKWKEDINVQLQ